MVLAGSVSIAKADIQPLSIPEVDPTDGSCGLGIDSRSGDPIVWCRRQQNWLVPASFNMTHWKGWTAQISQ
jgi:hypothetical protein